MKRVLFLVLIIWCSVMTVEALPVEVEGLHFHSSVLGQNVCYSVVLPDGYSRVDKYYPVLYMFHGIGGDNSSWLEYGNVARLMQRLSDDGIINQFIIVIPDGYQSYYSDAVDGSFSYETFFTKEFIPYIDSRYRTLANAQCRSVAGFSMGGFGALSIALRHRDMFGSVISLSASIRTDAQYTMEGPQDEWDFQWGRIFGGKGLEGKARLTSYYLSRSPYHIFEKTPALAFLNFGIMLDIGDKEKSLCSSNEELHWLLSQKGIRHEWEVRQGGHDFDCWNAALPKVFCFVDSCFRRGQGIRGDVIVRSQAITLKHEHKYNALKAILNPSMTATVYLPNQNIDSHRRYPIIYVIGDVTEPDISKFAPLVGNLCDSLIICPTVICRLEGSGDIVDAIHHVESLYPAVRGSQRMRALVCIGSGIRQCMMSLKRENLFTAIACENPIESMDSVSVLINRVKQYPRYPRFFIENNPDSPFYSFASKVHILMCDNSIEHEYRSRRCDKFHQMKQWMEWLKYINNRIHI